MISEITKRLIKCDLVAHLKAAGRPGAYTSSWCYHDGHIDGALCVLRELANDLPELAPLVAELEHISADLLVDAAAPDEEIR